MREALEQSKPDAMVLGPYDHKNLMPYTNLPCYVVHPTIQDFLLLHPYIQDYERTAVVLSKRDVIDLPALEGCLNIRYNLFSYRSQAEIPGIVQDLKKAGVPCGSIQRQRSGLGPAGGNGRFLLL